MSNRKHHPQALDVLRKLIGPNPKGITATIDGRTGTMYVGKLTPELAAALLEHCNWRNRKIRSGKVREWMEYLAGDKWQPQGHFLFTDQGEMIEGQHRTAAVRDSGVGVQIFVLVRPAAQARDANRYLDIGAYRTLGDFLRYHDVPTPYRVAPVLTVERNERVTGDPLQPVKGTKDQYLTIYQEIGDEPFKRAFDLSSPRLARRLGFTLHTLDWFALRAGLVEESGAQLFFGLLGDPSQLKATDPPLVLDEYLREMKERRPAGRRSQHTVVEQLSAFAKTWRLFGENKPASRDKIRHRLNERWPGIFGEE